jgi:TRAP-type C4-dicarboxylate transport system substrate-binding protein
MVHTIQSLARRVLPAAAVALLLPFGANAETLKLAHFVPPAHVVTSSVVQPLVDGVAKSSNGDLVIEVYPGGELGAGPMEQYVRALNGVADITWGVSGYTSSQFPKSMIAEMPGAFPDKGKGYEAIWRAYDKHLTSEYPGTKPLALWVSEPSVFIMRDKEIRTPADLKGLKIRVSGDVSAKLMEAFGATPVHMSASETYNALQTGLVDGCVTGASAIRDFKFDEVANVFTTGPALGSVMFYLVMNRDKYDGLSDAQKAALDANVGEALSGSGEAGWNKRAEETLAALEADPSKTVIKLTEAESKPFDDIAFALRDKVIKEMDANGLDASATLATMQGK